MNYNLLSIKKTLFQSGRDKRYQSGTRSTKQQK